MLKLSVKPGEYITIGENVKVIFTGGNERAMYIAVEAPREYTILRNKLYEEAMKKSNPDFVATQYYKDSGLSKEAKEKIKRIVQADRRNWPERNN